MRCIFFNDTATTEIYTLALHDALPIYMTFSHHMATVNGIQMHYVIGGQGEPVVLLHGWPETWYAWHRVMPALAKNYTVRSEEHTSELQSRQYLVCRLLLEKTKKTTTMR